MPALRFAHIALLLVLSMWPARSSGQENKPARTKDEKNIEQIAEDAKKSVVVILYTGRDGKQHGLGTGFIISEDGQIATNFHVIGEARPITVQLSDGATYQAIGLEASDRKLDLAIVRIEPNKKLPPLRLGDSSKLKAGQPIIALGHPQGLEYSVVTGVLSGRREMDGVSMLQLAIPIEQGNSGGPVLDPLGNVLGIVTMKSLVTANLGFAVPVNALKQLRDRPNPITMEQWLTIGALDKSEWKTMHGGRWRQRAGRIVADGTGTGFGGRTLCLAQRPAPPVPHELTVTVKLDDESGAAGLIFGGDGGDKHYGFYPTGGKLRLTRFDGPTVYSWKILHDQATSAYRPGEWNTLKVRLEKDKVLCFVNDEEVARLQDPEYYGTAEGLAKFRQTVAEFKRFQSASHVAIAGIPVEARDAFERALPKLSQAREVGAKELQPLLKYPSESATLLRDKARQLEAQASQMRKLAETVQHERNIAELAAACTVADARIDLVKAALLIAKLDNEELEVDAYYREVDRLARLVSERVPKDATPAAKIESLNKFLFKERGFHGSHHDYYSRSNSYLNEVMDDREGLPITLSVLYMEIARRLKLNVVGVPLPGHFMVRHEPKGGEPQLVDVFDGQLLSREEAEKKVKQIARRDARDKDFAAVTKKAILVRMLHNLLNLAESEKDGPGMLRYLDAIVTIEPAAHEERWARAVLRFQSGVRSGSLEDCELLLKQAPPSVDIEKVQELKRLLDGAK